jgi:DNA-binding HxlR family transcriptional regulator
MSDRVRKPVSIRKGYADRQKEEIRRSVQLAIALIQGKWKIGILSNLQRRPVRLSQLRKMFPQASKKMLAQHLREMERDGLIIRTDLSGRLRHVEYSLSDYGGPAAVRLINTVTESSSQHASLLPKPGVSHSAVSPRGSESSPLGIEKVLPDSHLMIFEGACARELLVQCPPLQACASFVSCPSRRALCLLIRRFRAAGVHS